MAIMANHRADQQSKLVENLVEHYLRLTDAGIQEFARAVPRGLFRAVDRLVTYHLTTESTRIARANRLAPAVPLPNVITQTAPPIGTKRVPKATAKKARRVTAKKAPKLTTTTALKATTKKAPRRSKQARKAIVTKAVARKATSAKKAPTQAVMARTSTKGATAAGAKQVRSRNGQASRGGGKRA